MREVQIKIKKHWNVPPADGYSIGDEYSATIHLCTDTDKACYAILDNGYHIPSGCFDIISHMPLKPVGEICCHICDKELTAEEKSSISRHSFNVTCAAHHYLRNASPIKIAQAIAGINNHGFSDTDIERFKEYFPNDEDDVLSWLMHVKSTSEKLTWSIDDLILRRKRKSRDA